MSWLDSLDEEQQLNAIKVGEAAKKQGVSPALAMALAFQESGLRHSSKGNVTLGPETKKGRAIGMMQLMPGTAKELGVDPHNESENIDGGIKYLKSMMNQYKDPVLAAAAYNHGPSGSFFKGGDLPPETKDYLNKIESYGGFESITEEAKPGFVVRGPAPPNAPAQETRRAYDLALSKIAGGAGAGAGALVGAGFGGMAKLKAMMDLRDENLVSRAVAEASPAAQQVMRPDSQQAMRPGAQPAGVGTAQVMEPGRMTAGDKWAKEIGGPGGATAEQAYENYRLRKTLAPGETLLRSGIALPPTTYTPGSTIPDVIRAEAAAKLARETPSTLESMGRFFARNPVISRTVMGGLGGAGAGFGGAEAISRYESGDIPGAVLSGIGALGSAASIVPALAPVAAPIAMAAPLATLALDQYRKVRPVDKRYDEPVTEQDIERASRPYYNITKQRRGSE